MFSKFETLDSFHNIFSNGDWNLEKIKNYFGDTPEILINVLRRRSCSVGVVKLLLNQGADINYQTDSNYSPLMTALEVSNDTEVIRVLLERGADVNKVDMRGRTPLLRFLRREDCSVDIVEVLLDFEADVNRMDKYGVTPLATAICESKDDAIIRLLVERGAEVNDLRNLHVTPLLVLLRERQNCSVDTVKFLLDKGADINCMDDLGCSPLMTALRYSNDEAVILALLERGANVNMVCKNGETPLLRYLGYFYGSCSVRIVKLLLHYKAEVNSKNNFGDTPLLTALKFRKGEGILRILLEEGADINTLDTQGKSPLCVAFRNSSNDIVKLLLDARCSPKACQYHTSALHCATDFSYSGLREDILKLLLETNIDVNSLDKWGRSCMCSALQSGGKAHDIQLLLDSGVSLNACKLHSLPLMCATGHLRSPLREEVVQLLLDNGAGVGEKGLQVLQGALGYCEYETGAIQLLLDLPGLDAYVVANECNESLLHLAVQNPNCRPDAVKLLVHRKAQVHKENQNGETPLHCAIKNRKCDPGVINLLLQNGSPVNVKNKSDETPLMLAVKEEWPAIILKDLLIAGALIGKAKFCHGNFRFRCELLEFLARKWETCDYPERVNSYRMLLKFYLLQNPECGIGDVDNYPGARPYYKEKLLTFMNKCLSELGKMDSFQVGHEYTFRMFVRRDCLSIEKMFDLDQILIHLIKNTFPVFFDIISARIGRQIMEAEVKKLQVYTSKICSDLPCVERVYLNCDILHNISQYLPVEDLLKFILAFYRPVNQNDNGEGIKDNTLLSKRNSEPSFKLHKRQKLYR